MNKLKNITEKITFWNPGNIVSYIVYGCFAVLFFIVSYFHEPWLDEAQAWLIARDASYYDIIFVMPHYEGHPPLWWLILSVPAKLGLPYEYSLTALSLMVSMITVYFIIFRSPFCSAFRLSLPFTFFIFYQYGVIARPYSILILSFVLAAVFYKDKNEKPFRYVLALVLLCLSSGYGIVLAGGIALVWCAEITGKFGERKDFMKFLKTPVFSALMLLLVSAVMIVMIIKPADDVFLWSKENYRFQTFQNPDYMIKGRIFGILYLLLLLPADCMVSGGVGIDSSLTDYCSRLYLPDVIALGIPGLFIMAYLLILAYRSGKLKLFIIPYGIFVVFSDFVYFNRHHIGIAAVFYIFIIWVCKSDVRQQAAGFSIRSFRGVEFIVISCYLVMNISWTLCSSAGDIMYRYDYGRELSAYIRENGYDGSSIMAQWRINECDGFEFTNTNAVYIPVSAAPYFKENVFLNLNCGKPEMSYVIHKKSDVQADYLRWSEKTPDVLVGQADIDKVYGDKVKFSDYYIDAEINYRAMWKASYSSDNLLIYVRKDINTGD